MREVRVEDVRAYWDAYPADHREPKAPEGTKEYFDMVRRLRYGEYEPFLRDIVGFEQYKGKKVLEIGCGMGSDGVSFAIAGAEYTGIDLTPHNVELARKQLECYGVTGTVRVMDAENLEFPDNAFDCVYSHGVIHHSLHTEAIVGHIYRTLKPGGHAHVMVYHRNSFRYYVEIMALRRIGILLLGLPGRISFVQLVTRGQAEAIEEYRNLLKKEGFSLLRSGRFLTINTDTAYNPLSKVYTRKTARKLFGQFERVGFRTAYMDWRRLPLLRNMTRLDSWLSKRIGWFLFIKAYKGA